MPPYAARHKQIFFASIYADAAPCRAVYAPIALRFSLRFFAFLLRYFRYFLWCRIASRYRFLMASSPSPTRQPTPYFFDCISSEVGRRWAFAIDIYWFSLGISEWISLLIYISAAKIWSSSNTRFQSALHRLFFILWAFRLSSHFL